MSRLHLGPVAVAVGKLRGVSFLHAGPTGVAYSKVAPPIHTHTQCALSPTAVQLYYYYYYYYY